jgi:hypothetical protein
MLSCRYGDGLTSASDGGVFTFDGEAPIVSSGVRRLGRGPDAHEEYEKDTGFDVPLSVVTVKGTEPPDAGFDGTWTMQLVWAGHATVAVAVPK